MEPEEAQNQEDQDRHASAGDDPPGESGAGAPSERRRRLRLPRPRLSLVLAVIGGALVLGCAGAAFATYEYSKDYKGRILPGSSIAGVDVSGMTKGEALRAVREAIHPDLHRSVDVVYKDKTWMVSPKDIGAVSDARAAVEAALQASEEASFFSKVGMRVFGDELDFDRSVAIQYPRKGVRGFVEGLAASYDREVRDATIDYSTGWVEIVEERDGRRVKVDKSYRELMSAFRGGGDEVDLAVETTKPERTTEDFDHVLLLRIGENRLYLYEDGKIKHEWTVATGQPAYPTPTGLYEITEKRYMPTWVNPDPEGWGANMPASIPPGPSNPLGTRALNWSASGIRFHGTLATYSLGYNASHGCVRMAMSDVEFLYDIVDVGAPIVSVQSSADQPMYDTSPDPVVVAEDAPESAADEEPPASENLRTKSPGKKNG